MYTARKIESVIELPYNLIDINTGSEHFIFRFKAFDDNQTDYSIKTGGVTGKFNIIYQSKGISCDFECDITVGNVYDFYISLGNAYDNISGKDPAALLKNYGNTLNRTNLTIGFDNKGHCFVEGCFKNKDNYYKSGVIFSFEVDQTYITEILDSMEIFFRELRRLQGHSNFY